jgi:hypothetical protein
MIGIEAPVHRLHELTHLLESAEPGFRVETALFEDPRQIVSGVIKADVGALKGCHIFVRFEQLANPVAQHQDIGV